MQTVFGLNAGEMARGMRTPTAWNSDTAVNGHMLLVGMSGAGKTYRLKRMIRDFIESASPSNVPRIHVFDVHGDIDVPNASTVMFSEQCQFGLNPLVVDPDPNFGGVRKRVQSFISTINKTDRQLGGKQQAVLRNLLLDVYEKHGFKADEPSSWRVSDYEQRLVSDGNDGRLYIDVPRAEKDEAKALGARWDPAPVSCWYIQSDAYSGPITRWPPKRLSRCNPSINDVLNYAQHILKQSFLGTNQKAVTQLEIASRCAQTMQKKLFEALKRGDGATPDPELLEQFDKAKVKAADAYMEFLDVMHTGTEFDTILKYDSMDVLKSVIDRLENLNSTGIFRPVPPPFDEQAPVWRYNISPLNLSERKMFVLFKLGQLFMQAIQRGEQKEIVDVIILDEAHVYSDDDPDNIINFIAKEARKFGVALICASQNPNHFPDDFVTSVGTKIILGIDESHWPGAMRKMRLEEKALKYIKLQKTALVQVKQRGDSRAEWQWIHLHE